MAVINILDKHTAELIAAGEVVERPASVVKELCENSIDAGAKAISVAIEKGGIALIQISDNGSGIEADYIPTAFIRHATSKIKTGQDLENINTLGFRGEALASVSAVAKVELITKTQQDEFASKYTVHGGEEISFEADARPDGTTINVRDLFYNTPARIKFLKKDVSEANFVSDVVTQLALSHPEISFSFVREGKKQFKTSGDGNLKAAAYEVLSRDFAKDLAEVFEINNGYEVKGLITLPIASRASRAMQFFFVNGRFVKNTTMMSALEAAYKGTLMQKKYPGCILFLQLPPQLVDVNVHPAKTQVRFAKERDVFGAVYTAVKSALYSVKGEVRQFELSANSGANSEQMQKGELQNSPKSEQKQKAELNFQKAVFENDSKQSNAGSVLVLNNEHQTNIGENQADISAKNDANSEAENINSKYPKREYPAIKPRSLDIFADDIEPVPCTTDEMQNDDDFVLRQDEAVKYKGKKSDDENTWRNALKNAQSEQEKPQQEDSTSEDEHAQNEHSEHCQLPLCESATYVPPKVIGEVFNTYLIIQSGDNMCLIDKHAAHERIIYEKLVKDYKSVNSQLLLVPVSVKLSASEKNAVMQYEQIIKDSGIEVEDFGGNEVIIRAVPMDTNPNEAGELLVEIADKLVKNPRESKSEKMQWTLHSIACKAAIKGGDKTPIASLLQLAEDVLQEKIPLFCPHGRPMVLKITKKEIEKQFGR